MITSWNKGAEEVYGYSQDEIIGRPISTLIPFGLDKEANELTQMIKRGEKVDHYETIRLKKNGTLINVSLALSPVFDIRGKLIAISVIARDITQRKNQEQEREMSMKFLQLMNACKGTGDLIRSVVSFFREHYGFEAVGIRLKEGFDYPYFEASGFPEKFVFMENSLCTFDDAGKPLCDTSGYPIHECMCGNVINGRFDPSMPFFTKRGSFWSNCTTELLATTTEADRQVRIRNRCNGEGYESVALISLYIGEERIGLIQLNDKRSGMFTLEMIKFFERLTDYLVVALSKTRTDEILRETYEKLQEQSKELELAYSSLKESEKRLAEAQRMAHVGNMEWNLVTGEIHWSEELYRIFRRNPLESGTTYDEFLNYIHPDDLEYVIIGSKKALIGEPVAGNYTIVLTNGEERKLHTNIEVIFDERNTPIRMKGTFQDITELTKAEEKLRESEEKYRNIVETANEGVVIINENFRATYVNQKMADMVGYNAEECLSKHILDFLSEDSIEIVINNFKQRSLGTNGNYEFRLKRKDGSLVCVLSSAKAIFDKDGKFVGSLSMLTDITQKKEAEQELANIEIARKKEIHHRIKNNLQVISSLLDLQADKFRNRDNIKDSEVLEAFRESQDRVISMALIHEELYRGGGGFERLNFSPYVEELAENIFQTYRLGKENIMLNLYIDNNVFFNIDVAVPLGMIINELVSNAFKHAFEGRNEGEIQIKLHREEIGSYFKSVKENSASTAFALTISDNGVGIPACLDIDALDSLGLQLVTSLVSQLDGKLEIKRNKGTKFIIRFTITDKNNQIPLSLSQHTTKKTYM